jgi:hypothetical protein
VAGQAHDRHRRDDAAEREQGQRPPDRRAIEAQGVGEVREDAVLELVDRNQEGPAGQRDDAAGDRRQEQQPRKARLRSAALGSTAAGVGSCS